MDTDDSNESAEAVAMMVLDGTIPGIGQSELWEEEKVCIRRVNKRRSFKKVNERFEDFYFCEHPVYSNVDFERRFRMPRYVFDRVEAQVTGRGLFVQRRDATLKEGITPRMRIISSIRILAYGASFDQVDELCELSEASARESFYAFADEVVEVFGDEYLRAPTEVDLRRILGINAARGFPGCVGSWDCQHWAWKNCPVAWAGQFKGKEKKPTIVLEAIADAEMWIWGCHFGNPGSMNDINVLDCSPLVGGILNGTLLPSFEYEVNRKKKNCLYFLVDGIYPQWSIFVSTIAEGTTRKENVFAAAQEAIRKDVERAFGVLISRWGFLQKPCTLWDRDTVAKVVKCAVILHNMVVEARRDGYDCEFSSLAESAVKDGHFLDKNGNEKRFVWQTEDILTGGSNSLFDNGAWARHIAGVDARMKDEVKHFELKLDLIEHIWTLHGNH